MINESAPSATAPAQSAGTRSARPQPRRARAGLGVEWALLANRVGRPCAKKLDACVRSLTRLSSHVEKDRAYVLGRNLRRLGNRLHQPLELVHRDLLRRRIACRLSPRLRALPNRGVLGCRC